MKMKRKQLIFLIALAVLTLGFFSAKAVLSGFDANLKQVAQTAISDVDLSTASDGDYLGSFTAFPISAQVKVSINNHAIKQIELIKHENGQGKNAETLPSQVVSAQSLDVDCISGATYSSKVILKAIENALMNSGAKSR